MQPISPPKKFTITVTSGTGTATTTGILGELVAIGIKPPSGAIYDIDITDVDGYGVGGRANNNGITTIRLNGACYDNSTITISNASPDGSYSVKLWYCGQSL